MSYDDLLSQIYAEFPHLTGCLNAPRVVYVTAQNKAYITFESTKLVEEATFLRLEALLRRVFHQSALALRVVSPALGDDFRAHIDDYRQVLVDFLKRNYPASTSWMDHIGWRCAGDLVPLTFPDTFSMEYMARQNASARLADAG